MRTRTAEDMVLDVRQRADMVGSDFVSDDEILEYLNQEFAELRGIIRRAEGQPFARSESAPFVTSVGVSTYTLPADFAELLSVKRTYAGREVALKPFTEFERAQFANPGSGPPTMYRLNGDNIDLLPVNEIATIVLAYVAGEGRLQFSPGSPNTYDGVQGFEMAAIYGATATCLQKEESDPSFYLGQKDRIVRHIQAMAGQRDGGQPERVTDVVGWNPWEF